MNMQGFHTCVGGGGERQTPDWYKEKGIEVILLLIHSFFFTIIYDVSEVSLVCLVVGIFMGEYVVVSCVLLMHFV